MHKPRVAAFSHQDGFSSADCAREGIWFGQGPVGPSMHILRLVVHDE